MFCIVSSACRWDTEWVMKLIIEQNIYTGFIIILYFCRAQYIVPMAFGCFLLRPHFLVNYVVAFSHSPEACVTAPGPTALKDYNSSWQNYLLHNILRHSLVMAKIGSSLISPVSPVLYSSSGDDVTIDCTAHYASWALIQYRDVILPV